MIASQRRRRIHPPHHANTGAPETPDRAARPGPSLRKERLLGMTSKLGS